MANIYIDYSTGNDSTGNGTSGTPYKTLQKAINVANGSDTVFIANTTAQVLTANITWNTGFGGTTAASGDNPLHIKPWNNGGSITISHPISNILAAEVNGNSAVSTLFSATSMPQYVTWEGIKFHGTMGILMTPGNYWSFYRCEFYGAAGSTMVAATNIPTCFIECYFHDDGGSSVDALNVSSDCLIYGCYFGSNISGFSLRFQGSGSTACNNIIKSGTEGAVLLTTKMDYIFNNTIIGTGASNQIGISFSSSITERNLIWNNIITDFSGTGAKGINFIASSNALLLGYNAFRNNTTNISSKTVVGFDFTANDVTESSSPYTNSGSGDYSLVSTALSKAAGMTNAYVATGTRSYTDLGASQRQEQTPTIAYAFSG